MTPPTETLHVRTPAEIVAAIRRLAEAEERSVNQIVVRLLRAALEDEIEKVWRIS